MKKIIILSLLIVCAYGAEAQIISTIAGGGATLGDGGPAVDCELHEPQGICMDNTGNLYIADAGNNRIRKINTAGIITTIAGTGVAGYNGDNMLATAAQLNYPTSIIIDETGNIYFPDDHNFRIRKINTSGIITTIAGNGTEGNSVEGSQATATQIGSTEGMCMDRAGNIYFADIRYSVIRKINTTGIITTYAGIGTNGYTGDEGPATAAKIQPFGLGIDAVGNIYSAEYQNNCIRKIDAAGIISTVAGSGTPGYTGDGGNASVAQFFHPSAVRVDVYNDLFIADGDNHVVRKIDPSGIITTIAGNHTNGNSGDGNAATSAELSFATDVVVTNSGDVYIVDWGNSNVRYIYTTVGVNTIEQPTVGIVIYPNPTNGHFSIQINTISEQANVVVTNVIGEKIKELSIDCNSPEVVNIDVPNGIYFIEATTNSNVYSGKVNVIR